MTNSNCNTVLTRISAGLAVAFLVANGATDVLAHGAGGDIALFTTADGQQVDVGFAELDDDDIHQIFFDPNDSVFNAILLPRTPSALPPIPYAIGSPEPGFDANENALPPLATINFNTLDLSYWNGSGAVSFGPVAGVSGGYAPQPSTSSADGGHHSHPVFGLLGASVPGGVYLAEMSVSVAGLADSDRYYLVALVDSHLYTGDADMDAENAEAVGEMVRSYLDDPSGAPQPVFNGKNYTFYADAIGYAEGLVIPEPSAAALAAAALAGLLATRYRT